MLAKRDCVGLSEKRGERQGTAASDLIIGGVLADDEWVAVNNCNRASTRAGRLWATGFLLLSSWPRLHCLWICFRGLLLGIETDSVRSENNEVMRV